MQHINLSLPFKTVMQIDESERKRELTPFQWRNALESPLTRHFFRFCVQALHAAPIGARI
jgi:hypothetical protein